MPMPIMTDKERNDARADLCVAIEAITESLATIDPDSPSALETLELTVLAVATVVRALKMDAIGRKMNAAFGLEGGERV